MPDALAAYAAIEPLGSPTKGTTMGTNLCPYLALEGTTREALGFYAGLFGGEPRIMTFAEVGAPVADGDLVMHGQLDTPLGFTIMASDSNEVMPVTPGDTVAMSLTGTDNLQGHFDALADGGEVVVPFAPQMWGDTYGQVRDRFGVLWHVNQTKA